MPSVRDTTQQINEPIFQEGFNQRPVNPLKTIILIVVGLIIVSALARAAFWYGKKSTTTVIPEKEATSTPEKAKEELPPATDEMVGWKSYMGETLELNTQKILL